MLSFGATLVAMVILAGALEVPPLPVGHEVLHRRLDPSLHPADVLDSFPAFPLPSLRHLHRKRSVPAPPVTEPKKSSEGTCDPVAKYFMNSETMIAYVNSTMPSKMEEVARCKGMRVAGCLGTLLDVVSNLNLPGLPGLDSDGGAGGLLSLLGVATSLLSDKGLLAGLPLGAVTGALPLDAVTGALPLGAVTGLAGNPVGAVTGLAGNLAGSAVPGLTSKGLADTLNAATGSLPLNPVNTLTGLPGKLKNLGPEDLRTYLQSRLAGLTGNAGDTSLPIATPGGVSPQDVARGGVDAALGLTDGGAAALDQLPGADGLLAATKLVPAPQQNPASVGLQALTNRWRNVRGQLRGLLGDSETGPVSKALKAGGEKRKAALDGSAQSPGGKVGDVATGATGQGPAKAGDSKASPLLGSVTDVTNVLDLGNMADLVVQDVQIENVTTVMQDDGNILCRATARVTLAGSGLLAPVLDILGFEVCLTMEVLLGPDQNNSVSPGMKVLKEEFLVTCVKLQLLDLVSNLPVPVDVTEVVGPLVSIALKDKESPKNSENSTSKDEEQKTCSYDLSDFNRAPNSTGMFNYTVCNLEASKDGWSMFYRAEGKLSGTSMSMPGCSDLTDDKSANHSLTICHEVLKEIVKSCAKESSTKMENLQAVVTLVQYAYSSNDRINMVYAVKINDGSESMTGETETDLQLECTVTGYNIISDTKILRTKHTLNTPENMDKVKDLMTAVQNKMMACINGYVNQWNVPSVEACPIIKAKLINIDKNNLRAVD